VRRRKWNLKHAILVVVRNILKKIVPIKMLLIMKHPKTIVHATIVVKPDIYVQTVQTKPMKMVLENVVWGAVQETIVLEVMVVVLEEEQQAVEVEPEVCVDPNVQELTTLIVLVIKSASTVVVTI